MSDRSSWSATTHDWSRDVDVDHLASLRAELSLPGVAGGIRHLILEVLAYAQDEAAAAHRHGSVVVARSSDGSVSVGDDGRGTDTRTENGGLMVRKPIMSTPDIRFLDPTTSPVLPDGLPRRGMSSVAALSAVLTHENHRANGAWARTYRHGIPNGSLSSVEPRDRPGTTVTFTACVDGPDWLTESDLAAFPNITIVVGSRQSST